MAETRCPILRLALVAAAAALLGSVLALAGALRRPDVAVNLVDRLLLVGEPVRILVDEAHLERAGGDGPWGWRIRGLAVLSHDIDTPSLHVREAFVSLPDVAALWSRGEIATERVEVDGFIIYQPRSREPPPFEEIPTWPVSRLRIGRGAVQDFDLVLRDPYEVWIEIHGARGQLRGFLFDFGTRRIYGRGEARGDQVEAGPLWIERPRAPTLRFDGTALHVAGTGRLAGQPLAARLDVVHLFRAEAGVICDVDAQNVAIEPIVRAVVPDAPEIAGLLGAKVHVTSGEGHPPGLARIVADLDLVGVAVRLDPSTSSTLRTALALAPFVDLRGDVVFLRPVYGSVHSLGYRLDLTGVRYEAPRSVGYLEGFVDAGRVDALLHFVPNRGKAGIEWGLALEGPIEGPTARLLLGAALAKVATPRAREEPAGPARATGAPGSP